MSAKDKFYYRVTDIMDMYGIGIKRAYKLIQEVRAYNEPCILPKGNVTVEEFARWRDHVREGGRA